MTYTIELTPELEARVEEAKKNGFDVDRAIRETVTETIARLPEPPSASAERTPRLAHANLLEAERQARVMVTEGMFAYPGVSTAALLEERRFERESEARRLEGRGV